MAPKLTLNTIRRIADPRSFGRGEQYFALGLVRSMTEYNGTITAKVEGTHKYTVKLQMDNGDVEHSCTCPMGDEDIFCKHCVAVGLTWIEGGSKEKGEKGRKAAKAEITFKAVKDHLESLEKNALVEMIMQQAQEDDHLREKLFMQTAKTVPGGPNLGALKKIIRNAIQPGDFIDYHSMRSYARNVDNVLDTIEDLLTDGRAMEVIELAEFAIEEAEVAIQSVDGSNGEMGDMLHRLQEIHLAACRKAKPDPEKLAARLFDKEMNGEWEVFYGAAKTYAPILRKKGLAIYRRLAEEEWSKIKPLGATKEEREERSHRRFNITHIMETLADLSGDVEAMVEVKKRDLSFAYHYLQIAELYAKDGKQDKALEWAEAGLKAFPERTDPRLRDFLTAVYHRGKRHDEAMKLMWLEFAEHSSLENYGKLNKNADRIGQWITWREKALDFVRKEIEGEKRKSTVRSWGYSPDNSLLVDIFLWEKDPDAAWREARAGGCSQHLWMKLAANREKDHPEDAITVYKKWIDPISNRKNNRAYEEAAALIRKIQVLQRRLKQDEVFADFLLAVRVTHKQKRNFMKLLDKIKP
jgi:uncharacterized Zn finger protein